MEVLEAMNLSLAVERDEREWDWTMLLPDV